METEPADDMNRDEPTAEQTNRGPAFGGSFQKIPVPVDAELVEEETEIRTLEGTMTARPGDVIITGIQGERYPCKAEVFAKSYVPTDPNELELFRKCVPEGVEIVFEEINRHLTLPEAAYIKDYDSLSHEQREEAVRFVRDYVRIVPTLRKGADDLETLTGEE